MEAHGDLGFLQPCPDGVELRQRERARTSESGDGRGPDQDGLGAVLEHPVELPDCLVDDRQCDHGCGEDAILVIETPHVVQPSIDCVDCGVCEIGVSVERVLEQVRKRGEHECAVHVELVEQLEPGSWFAECRDAIDRLSRHLPQAPAFRVRATVEVDVSTGRSDLLEGRVGHVVGDLAFHRDARASTHLHELDVARVLLREVLREHGGRLVQVIVGVEDGKARVRHDASHRGSAVSPRQGVA